LALPDLPDRRGQEVAGWQAIVTTLQPAYTYAATVERVVDADTLDVALDLGMRIQLRTRLRLADVDAPERFTSEGREATEFVSALLSVLGHHVVVETQKPDKYGRALAAVQLGDGTDLADQLLSAGHARPYDGGAR
jgi:micrococcal nuclease